MNPVYDKVDKNIMDNFNNESGLWQGWQVRRGQFK